MRRVVKKSAIRFLNSPLGSNRFLAEVPLRAVKLRHDFGESPKGIEGPRAYSCVSVDFDVTVPSRSPDNMRGTAALLRLAEAYAIPITWAVCGRTAEEDMKSYAAIVNASGRDEIGVHTYSHLDASASTRGEFEYDVKMCIQALGLDSPKSFVFPWNREGHYDVLRELGFRAFRGKTRVLGMPGWQSGLWNIRPVYYLDQKSLGSQSLIGMYVDLCIRNSAVFHLWTHPWCLSVDGSTKQMEETIASVFGYIAARRKEGVIQTATMGQLAGLLDSNSIAGTFASPSLAEVGAPVRS